MKKMFRSSKLLVLFFLLALPALVAFRTNIGFWQNSCPIPGGKAIFSDRHDYVEVSCNMRVSPPTLMYKYYPLQLWNTCGYGIASKGYDYNCSGPGAVWNGGGCSAGRLICNNLSTAFTRYPNSAPPLDFVFGTKNTEGTFYSNSGNDNDYGDTCVSYDGKRTLTLFQCGDVANYYKSCPQGYNLTVSRGVRKGHPYSITSCTANAVLMGPATSTSSPTNMGPKQCSMVRRRWTCTCPSGEFIFSNNCYSCPSGSTWNGSTCVSCPSGDFAIGTSCYACPPGGAYNGSQCVAPLKTGSIVLSW